VWRASEREGVCVCGERARERVCVWRASEREGVCVESERERGCVCGERARERVCYNTCARVSCGPFLGNYHCGPFLGNYHVLSIVAPFWELPLHLIYTIKLLHCYAIVLYWLLLLNIRVPTWVYS
jgi:hypothetical protein